MVHYDFYCDTCGQFEHKQPITDPLPTKCPKCKGAIRQIYSVPTIVYVPFYNVENDEIVTHR